MEPCFLREANNPNDELDRIRKTLAVILTASQIQTSILQYKSESPTTHLDDVLNLAKFIQKECQKELGNVVVSQDKDDVTANEPKIPEISKKAKIYTNVSSSGGSQKPSRSVVTPQRTSYQSQPKTASPSWEKKILKSHYQQSLVPPNKIDLRKSMNLVIPSSREKGKQDKVGDKNTTQHQGMS